MKRFLLTIVGLLGFAIGMNAETYTHTFAQDELTTQGGNVALSGIDGQQVLPTTSVGTRRREYSSVTKMPLAKVSLSAHRLSRTLQSQV